MNVESCAICSAAFNKQSKPIECRGCLKSFHTKCSKTFVVAKFEDGFTSVICDTCRTTKKNFEIISKSRSNSVSSISDGESTKADTQDLAIAHTSSGFSSVNSSAPSTTNSSTAPSPTPSSDSNFAEIKTLLAGLTSVISNIGAKVDLNFSKGEESMRTVTEQIMALNERVAPLDLLPDLMKRIDVVEDDIKSLRREHQVLRDLVTEHNNHPSISTEMSTAVSEKLSKLEEENKQLHVKIGKINTRHNSSSPKLIISGVDYGDAENLTLIAFSVLKVLRPSLTVNEIISARKLLPRRKPAPMNTESTASPSTPKGTKPKKSSPPLLLTLISPALVTSIIQAKITLGKFHCALLDDELLVQAGCTIPLSPALINVNEFLEGEAWELKREVLTQSRKDKNKFLFFVRNGNIYVKRQKDDPPTLITSKKDLESFL